MRGIAMWSTSVRPSPAPVRHSVVVRRSLLRSPNRAPRRRLALCAAQIDPEEMRKMQESMQEAMKNNPQMREKMMQMEEAMKNPQVREQVQQTIEYMQSDETRKRIEALREDPELRDKFKEIEKGGFGAMMKAMNDTAFLEKVGRAVGPPPGAQYPPPTQASAPPPQTETSVTEAPSGPPPEYQPPEIETILDAAKYGDLEAVEDFLAIGKDPNLADEYNRSPLHFAVSIQHMDIIDALLAAGADIELRDSKANTPLHYAAGYGRAEALKRLLDAGADGSVRNDNGKTPADVAKLSDQNPILQDAALIDKLNELASV